MAKKTSQKTSKKSPNLIIKTRARKLNRKQSKVKKKNSQQVAGGFKILKSALANLSIDKKLFFGLFVIYFILYFVLVLGLAANFQLAETKGLLDTEFAGEIEGTEKAATLFGELVSSAGSVSGEGASVYQSILFVVFSLATIWALRQTSEGKSVTIKQSLYKSMHPLIPYLLIYAILFLQMLPMLIGVSLYGAILSNNIAIGMLEQIVWLLVAIAGVFVSLYFGIGTFIASYIVTLSGMEPLKSLRLAKEIIKYRRFVVIRRMIFFGLVVLLFAVLIFVPLVIYLPIAAEVGFLILSLMMLTLFHAYSYGLYRELI